MNNIDSMYALLNECLEKIFQDDSELFDFGDNSIISERTLSSRLGYYLQNLLPDYNVDCEYNRHINEIKTIDGRKIYPDVIVHKRGIDDKNLAWIEVKKSTAGSTEIKNDRQRLKLVTDLGSPYVYKYGFLIIFDLLNRRRVTIESYENGQLVDSVKNS